MCLAEIVGMTGFATFTALIPQFQALWSLSNADAGWISGMYHGGYAVAVPLLVSLTDRVDARRIYLYGQALAAVSALDFALLADGFWSAVLWRTVAGIGMAGTYMTGLRAMNDRLPVDLHSRATAWYTALYGVGSGLSVYLTGAIEASWGWQWAAGAAVAGPIAAIAIARIALASPVTPPAPSGAVLDFRPVLGNRRAMGFIGGYGAHSFELFGYRSWLVAFLVYLEARDPSPFPLTPFVIAALIQLVGVPSSIIGNEMAQRWGRVRVAVWVMSAAAVLGLVVGAGPWLPYAVTVAAIAIYGWFVGMDSSTLTGGTVLAAEPDKRGATMALHSTVGFAFAFLSPLCFGVVLDLSGGANQPMAWLWAFVVMGIGAMIGPLCLWWANRGK